MGRYYGESIGDIGQQVHNQRSFGVAISGSMTITRGAHPFQGRPPTKLPVILPLNIAEIIGSEAMTSLYQHDLHESFPLEIYLCYRGEEFPPPVTNEDFARFNTYVYESLEMYYEARGYDPYKQALHYPNLDALITAISQFVMECAALLGQYAEAEMASTYQRYPQASYVFDSAHTFGHDGVSVTIQTTPDPYRLSPEIEVATTAQVQAGTSHDAPMTPVAAAKAFGEQAMAKLRAVLEPNQPAPPVLVGRGQYLHNGQVVSFIVD
jgi:hypothetical protein